MSSAPASASNTGTNQSRLQELLSQIPPVTKFLLAFNITIHILIFLFSYSIGNYAISSYQVLWQYEFYRVFSAAFVHVGILHLAMNMSSLFQMGPYLETQFGTLQFMFLTAWAVFVCGGLYVLMGWSMYKMTGWVSMLFSSGVGYSGILFAYAVIEAFHTTETTRSVFGCFNVPAKVYPFVLLVLLQVVIPGISFMGHVSGCVVGLLVVSGLLSCVLPSMGLQYICESSFLAIEAGCLIMRCPVNQMKEGVNRLIGMLSSRSASTDANPSTSGSRTGRESTGRILGITANTNVANSTSISKTSRMLRQQTVPNDEADIENTSDSTSILNPLLSHVVSNDTNGKGAYKPLKTSDPSSDHLSNIASV